MNIFHRGCDEATQNESIIQPIYNLVVRKGISDEKLKRFLSYYEFFTKNVIDLVEKEDKNTMLYSKYY